MFGVGQAEIGILVVYVVFAVATGALAAKKGRSGVLWGLLAFIFTPLVIIIVACLSTDETAKEKNMRSLEDMDYRDCPYCAEKIKREACVCKHCGKDVEPKESIPKLKCMNCGYVTPAGAPCIHCGNRLM